jgi:hypothetical protein
VATLLEWTDPSGATVAVELDLTATEAWELAAEVTDHPVEEGAAVSDHIRPGLDTLTLEGWVALAPLVVPRVDPSGLTGSVRATTVRAGGVDRTFTVLSWDREVDRRRVMDELFRALTAAGTLVSVTTSLRSVSDLAVTRYRVDRSKDTSGVLAVTLDLRRVRRVATSRVAVTTPAQRRGQRAGQRGAQPARATDRRSTLARALDSARSLLP